MDSIQEVWVVAGNLQGVVEIHSIARNYMEYLGITGIMCVQLQPELVRIVGSIQELWVVARNYG